MRSSSKLRHAAVGVILAFAAMTARGQSHFLDGVLSQSSDLAGCAARPDPVPHMSPGGIPSVANPDVGNADQGCSDLGSTYQVATDGHLYMLKRTSADVQRDIHLLALGTTPGVGVLAFQPTGLHVQLERTGQVMVVKLKQRRAAYTILYAR